MNSEGKLNNPKTKRPTKENSKEDMSLPPSFTPTYFRKLAQEAMELGVNRAKLAMDALNYYTRAMKKKKAPITKAMGSKELADKYSEANRKIAKEWWGTVSEEEKRERALKAVRARWAKKKDEPESKQ